MIKKSKILLKLLYIGLGGVLFLSFVEDDITRPNEKITLNSSNLRLGIGEVSNNIITDFEMEIVDKSYCKVSGTGVYNTDSLITTGGDSNINYSGIQPPGNYEFYEDEVLRVNPNNSFNLSLIQSNNWSMTLIWIDWNADADFEDKDELVVTFGNPSQSNEGPFSTTIEVPTHAVQGTTRMRVLTGDAWTTNLETKPCNEIANSTVKDFIIEVL